MTQRAMGEPFEMKTMSNPLPPLQQLGSRAS